MTRGPPLWKAQSRTHRCSQACLVHGSWPGTAQNPKPTRRVQTSKELTVTQGTAARPADPEAHSVTVPQSPTLHP